MLSDLTQPLDPEYKYWAFISYSHRDKKWGDWLHKGIETYRVPAELVGKPTLRGYSVPKRIFPVFRDREELPVSSNLGDNLQTALRQSRYLIVICSPNSAASEWVNEEVRYFKLLDREDRVLCLIADGEPNASDKPNCGFPECFPYFIRHKAQPGEDGAPTRTEPIAADVRSDKDGKGNALLKLVAGILGVDYDNLKQRDKRRRMHQRIKTVILAAAIIASVGLLLYMQFQARVTERYVEQGRKEWLAENSLRALPYFAEAYQRRPQDPVVRFLVGQAVNVLDVRAFSFGGSEDQVKSPVFSPDGLRLVAHSGKMWDAITGSAVGSLIGQRGQANKAVFSPDGRYLVTASKNIVQVWNPASGQSLVTLEGHRADIKDAQFSPDGRRIATASVDDTAKIWDVATGKLLITLGGHGASVLTASFSLDGKHIVTASADKTAKVWKVATGQLLMTLTGHSKRVVSAVFSPDGLSIATLSEDNSARLWRANTGREWKAVFFDKILAPSVAFAPDGHIFVVTYGKEDVAEVWDIRSEKLIASLKGHTGWIATAEISPDGRHVVTTSFDKTARLWDAVSGKQLMILAERTEGFLVSSARFSPDGTRIVTVDGSARATVWNTNGGVLLATLEGAWGKFTDDGKQVMTTGSGFAKVWNAENGQLLKSLEAQKDELNFIAFSFDGTRAVAASGRSTKMINMETGAPVFSLTLEQPTTLAAFSPDGSRILTVGRGAPSEPDTVSLREVSNGKLLCSWKSQEQTRELTSAAFSPNGQYVVTASRRVVEIWVPETGRLVRSYGGPTENASSPQFSADGKQIVMKTDKRMADGSDRVEESTATVYDVATGKLIAMLGGTKLWLNTVLFSPDGKKVIATGADRTARVWGVEGGKLLVTVEVSSFESAAFSPDGALFATAGEDSPKIWDAQSGKQLAMFDGHVGALSAISFSPDGKRLLTTGRDGALKVWKTGYEVRTPEEIASLVRQRVPWRLDNGNLVAIESAQP